MRWLMIVLLIAVSPVIAVYSGTFLEDFSDGNLDGWDISLAPGPPFPDLLRIEDGYLVMDTVCERGIGSATLELKTGNAD